MEGIDQVVVVVELPVRRKGGRYLNVKGVYEVTVEVRLEVETPGELGKEVLVVDSGNAARLDDFLVECGVIPVISLRHRFGYHDGEERLPGHYARVHVVENEAEVLLYEAQIQVLAGVGEVNLHLVVDVALPCILPLGVIVLSLFVDL